MFGTAARPSRWRRAVQWFVAVVVVVLLLVVGFVVWALAPMLPDREASMEARLNPAILITSTDNSIIMEPTAGSAGTGLVFIPGARVDPYAYMYTLSGLVEGAGVTVVITKPTVNFPILDSRPMSDFTDGVGGVQGWVVGGHSLGGVMACRWADTEPVIGLILFGSYCADDLSDAELAVLSIAGSNDGLSTPEKIESASHLLPDTAIFIEIEGLNHSGFGDYGDQPGDGESTLTREEERLEITTAILGTPVE
jgi:hypothetical protein